MTCDMIWEVSVIWIDYLLTMQLTFEGERNGHGQENAWNMRLKYVKKLSTLNCHKTFLASLRSCFAVPGVEFNMIDWIWFGARKRLFLKNECAKYNLSELQVNQLFSLIVSGFIVGLHSLAKYSISFLLYVIHLGHPNLLPKKNNHKKPKKSNFFSMNIFKCNKIGMVKTKGILTWGP